jgi:hypothetical protein
MGSDRLEIERNGISALVRRLQALYEFGEDEALARINAVNRSVSRRTDSWNASRYPLCIVVRQRYPAFANLARQSATACGRLSPKEQL